MLLEKAIGQISVCTFDQAATEDSLMAEAEGRLRICDRAVQENVQRFGVAHATRIGQDLE